MSVVMNFHGDAYGVSGNSLNTESLNESHLQAINDIAIAAYACGNQEIYLDAVALSNKIRQAIQQAK